jgi:hypothetical protein
MAYNIDIESIRELYKSMGNEEILAFAREDGRKLSTDAWQALKAELERREIGKQITDEIDYQFILEYSLRQRRFEEDMQKDLFNASLEYALTEKQKGNSQYNIYAGLIERGISEPYANYMINKLDEWAANFHNEALNKLQAAIIILLTGLMMLYCAFSFHQMEVFAIVLTAYGMIKIMTALDKKRKYRQILDNIRKEDSKK